MKEAIHRQDYTEDHTSRLVAMGEMAASLAHEIRNPLGSMELYCSVLKRELQNDSDKLELVNHIQQGINSLSHIVSNCLVFTKDVSVNKKTYQNAAMFLSETCKYVSDSNEHLGVYIGQPVESEHPSLFLSWKDLGDCSFMMDPYVLGQILLNVCRNALDSCSEKLSEKGSVCHVEVTLDHSQSDFWTLLVKDSGKGMNESTLEKIYDPFFTTKEKGTGLGLAIVLSLVKAHGGVISASSRESLGTEIKIKFYN